MATSSDNNSTVSIGPPSYCSVSSQSSKAKNNKINEKTKENNNTNNNDIPQKRGYKRKYKELMSPLAIPNRNKKPKRMRQILTKRLKEHINPKSFTHYNQISSEYFNRETLLNGISAGANIRSVIQRHNYVINESVSNLYEAVSVINVMDYILDDNDDLLNIDCSEHKLDEIIDKLSGEIELDERYLKDIIHKPICDTLSNFKGRTHQHLPVWKEQFNDLIMDQTKCYKKTQNQLLKTKWNDNNISFNNFNKIIDSMQVLMKNKYDNYDNINNNNKEEMDISDNENETKLNNINDNNTNKILMNVHNNIQIDNYVKNVPDGKKEDTDIDIDIDNNDYNANNKDDVCINNDNKDDVDNMIDID